MGKLEGRIALVTGGSSGIGLATARQQPELDAAVKDIGRNITAVSGDVSKFSDLDHLFDQIKSTKGRLDVLFANAGVAKYGKLGEITEALFDSIFASM